MDERTPIEAEEWSSVPWTFRVRMRRRLAVLKNKPETLARHERTGLSEEVASVSGNIHPKPYTYDEAVKCVERRLKHMTDEGWRIVTIRVMANGENE